MKSLILTTLAFAMLATAACSDSGGGKKKEEQPQPVGGTNEGTPTKKEETPKDYFNQFLFRTTGKCGSEYGVFYYYIQSEDISLEPAADGAEMIGVMELYLKQDNTFQSHFEERKVINREASRYSYEPMNEETRVGTWRILPNGRLELTSRIDGRLVAIAEGRAGIYNEFPIIEMHFRNDRGQLIDYGVKFGKVGSSESLIDICK